MLVVFEGRVEDGGAINRGHGHAGAALPNGRRHAAGPQAIPVLAGLGTPHLTSPRTRKTDRSSLLDVCCMVSFCFCEC